MMRLRLTLGLVQKIGQSTLIVAFASQGNAHDQYFFGARSRMIHGSVARPRFDLGNQELIEAHLHSVWMQHVGIGLKESVADVVDTDQPTTYPVRADIKAQLDLNESGKANVLGDFQAIAASVGDPLLKSRWYRPEWLSEIVNCSPSAQVGQIKAIEEERVFGSSLTAEGAEDGIENRWTVG